MWGRFFFSLGPTLAVGDPAVIHFKTWNNRKAGITFWKEQLENPYIALGETSPAAWKNTIRQYAAPYAELETENIILTVPTANVRNIENPEILLALWDKMMKAVADLASIPPVFPNPERIVADVQISAGKYRPGHTYCM